MKNTAAKTTGAMPSPDPEILGRIILIQSTLHLMGKGAEMARFLCRGFSRVPGMEKSGIFIDGCLYWENAPPGPEQQHCRQLFDQLTGAAGQRADRTALLTGFQRSHGVDCLPMETAFAVYGIFFCAPADEEMFFSYAPYIENTLNLAALVLENHSQQQMLLQHKSDLEKKVEERTLELARSEQRFRDLFNSISDLVYTQDLEGRLISVNPALHRLFGYRPEELLGRPISDFMLPEHRDRFESQYLCAILEKGSYEGITPYLTKDGSTIYIEYRSELVRPENDAPFISGIGRDVTGLGLSVVHGIVKTHGGSIRVRSQPGQGCEFEILLPAADKSAYPVSVQAGHVPRGQGRIPLIDDEPMIVSLNQQRLEKLGYRACGHTDPKAALEMFCSDPYGFDLVITDMTMPNITGDRLAGKILKIRPEMKIILCTGYSSQISDQTAASLGIARYLEKPVQMQQLAEAVWDVLSVSDN
ncbi:MAG: PAS domain S-box protein [Desulfosalsimonas sp.]